MSTTATEFEQLMQRVRTGCPEAAREVFERYNRDIQLLVRHRLSRRLRSQFDSLDFAQDAWASFFHVPLERYTFSTPDELVSFLARIAYHKLFDVYRRRMRKRSPEARGVEGLRPQTDNDPGNEPPMRQPTPSQQAIADEQWERLLEGLSPRVRRALVMLRTGHSQEEVAECLGVPTKMIQRLLQRLIKKLKQP